EGRYPYRFCSVHADGALSFNLRNNNWDWFLDLNGEPLYLIGNTCGTCAALYRHIRAHVPLAPKELSQRLEQGLTSIPEDVLKTVLPLLPKGEYIVGLIEIQPARLTSYERPRWVGCQSDYFWWRLWEHRDNGSEYELVLPFVAEADLDGD